MARSRSLTSQPYRTARLSDGVGAVVSDKPRLIVGRGENIILDQALGPGGRPAMSAGDVRRGTGRYALRCVVAHAVDRPRRVRVGRRALAVGLYQACPGGAEASGDGRVERRDTSAAGEGETVGQAVRFAILSTGWHLAAIRGDERWPE